LVHRVGWRAGVAGAAAILVACGGPAFSAAEGGGPDAQLPDGRAPEGGTDGGPSSKDGGRLDATLDGAVPDSTSIGDSASFGDVVVINLDAQPDVGVSDGGCDCLPSVAGWTGPGEVFVGLNGQGTAPSCNGSFPTPGYSGYFGIEVDDTCSCSCGAPTGQQCGTPTASYWTGACGVVGMGTQTLTETCSPVGAIAASNVSVASTGPTSRGACTASATGPPTAVSWTYVMTACENSTLNAGTCPSGLCVPSPDPGFSHICVWAPDQGSGQVCPAPYAYVLGDVAATGATDTLSCETSCSCGAVEGASCTTTLELGSNGCPSAAEGTVVTSSSCTALMGANRVAAVVTIEAGTCTPATSAPTGAVTKNMPTRFCCTTQ
jgi:hypothetical protein